MSTSQLSPDPERVRADLFYQQVRREYLDDAAHAVDELGSNIGAAAIEAMAVLAGKQHETCDIQAKIAPLLKEAAAHLKAADAIRDEVKSARNGGRGPMRELRIHAGIGNAEAELSHKAARKAAQCLTLTGHVVYMVKHIEGA